MKILYSLIIALFVSLVFSACGSGDGGFSFIPSSDNEIIKCDATNDIPNGYTTLNSGDTIVKSSENTVISIFHDNNNNKKVCVVSGDAYILSN